jgi:hypothetical protein
MNQALTRTLLFISYIKGGSTLEWVQHRVEWLNNQLAGGASPDHEYLYAETMASFRHTFTDTMKLARARQQIYLLKMTLQNLDEHVAQFERLAREGGYNLEDQSVKDMFGRSLPPALFAAILTHEHPHAWHEWVSAAEKQQQIYLTLKGYFGGKIPGKPFANNQNQNQNRPRPTQNQWQQAFSNRPRDQRRDPNTMDTSAHARARGISTEERDSLMKEGKCFNCRKTGHLSRFCPDRPPYQGPRPPYAGSSRARTTHATIEGQKDDAPPPSMIKVAINGTNTTAAEAIDFIKGLGDEVKDQVIQKVFMAQDF